MATTHKPIENLNQWMKGKIVKKVDTAAVNCTFIDFEDGSCLCIEAENVGPLNLQGPVYYEVQGKDRHVPYRR